MVGRISNDPVISISLGPVFFFIKNNYFQPEFFSFCRTNLFFIVAGINNKNSFVFLMSESSILFFIVFF